MVGLGDVDRSRHPGGYYLCWVAIGAVGALEPMVRPGLAYAIAISLRLAVTCRGIGVVTTGTRGPGSSVDVERTELVVVGTAECRHLGRGPVVVDKPPARRVLVELARGAE